MLQKAGSEEEDMEAVLKRGFGGRVVRHSPSYDYVYSRCVYWLGTEVYPRLRRPLCPWPPRWPAPAGV